MTFRGRVTAVDDAGIRQAAAKARQADVNILVLGDNTQRYSAFGRTSGENCDRDNIDLPGRQQELLEAVAASGRPTVLILMSGRALGVHWAAESPSVNAIVEAWEPGQMGGQAIAEILFGLVNPSGKLPVTVPRNAGQIQCVYNHKHSQYSRQFALAEQGPLYPFGFGLSYTSYQYSNISATQTDEGIQAEITVQNTGDMAGDEIVQCYFRDPVAQRVRPVRKLAAFEKVALQPGESKRIAFDIPKEALGYYDQNMNFAIDDGLIEIHIGGSVRDTLQANVEYHNS
jgi:beta-glucosidase